MSQGISYKVRRAIRAVRGRNNRTFRGKKLPSRRLIRKIVADAIISEILAEERAALAKAE